MAPGLTVAQSPAARTTGNQSVASPHPFRREAAERVESAGIRMASSRKSHARDADSAPEQEAHSGAIPLSAARKVRSAAQESLKPGAALDIAGRLALLREAFEKRARPAEGWHLEQARVWLEKARALAAKNRTKLIKVSIGVVIVAAVGYLPVRTLLQTTSTEAIINARLVTLRAPIEGEVGAGLSGLVSCRGKQSHRRSDGRVSKAGRASRG